LQLRVKGLDNDSDQAVMMSDNTAKLTSAVNTLPQLLEKKRLIDMHTTIATGNLIFFKHQMTLTAVAAIGGVRAEVSAGPGAQRAPNRF
jgi:hypothetical protein